MKALALISIPVLIFMCLLGAGLSSPAVPTPPGGQIYLMSPATTFWGMIQTIKQAPGSFILAKDQLLIFSWAIKEGGQAYAMINSQVPSQAIPNFLQEAGGNGSFVNLKDMDQIMKCLKENGWKAIPPLAVPEIIRMAIIQGYAWMIQLSNSLPTFVFVPVQNLPKFAVTPIIQ